MINFKISLLFPSIYKDSTYYLKAVLTNYKDQQSSYKNIVINDRVYEFTYNEKYSENENNQKTLSFSMNKEIVTANERYTNPFINYIHSGSLILLEDKDDNHHLFYVTSVKYNLQEFNSIYDVTCQDAFSYLLTKQRNGYTIENDINSKDFIGALNIDQWAEKIVDECYINYTYLNLSTGLCELEDGSLCLFSNLKEIQSPIKRILKEPYSNKSEDDKQLFQTFPFEASGSAGSVLISLGEEIGMHIKVAERYGNVSLGFMTTEDVDVSQELIDNAELWLTSVEKAQIQKFFWFEPTKNYKRLDLTSYSPTTDVQNFNLSHEGASLTTVLNVDGGTYGDEKVTLIPKVTPFFTQVFKDGRFWSNTKYSEGFFTSLCQKQQYIGQKGEPTSTDKDSNIFFYQTTIDTEHNQVIFNIIWPNDITLGFYDKISFSHEDFNINTYDESYFIQNNKTYTPSTSTWKLEFKTQKSGESYVAITEADEINKNDANYNTNSFRIVVNTDGSSMEITDSRIFLTFLRDPSTEDLEFAKVADACPWLENKIIDFKYFLDNNIITKGEYGQLMETFKNDLRQVNGELLVYAQEYYNALHAQTEKIANLTNELDLLGAQINNAFIKSYGIKGANTDISKFTETYDKIFNQGFKEKKDSFLLNYDNIKADYLNKFFDSQQRFLKNIKNFRDYFNAPIQRDLNYYQYNITLVDKKDNEYIYSYKNKQFIAITTGNIESIYNNNKDSEYYGQPYYPIYKNKKVLMKIADKSMKLYERISHSETPLELNEHSYYSKTKHYFLPEDSENPSSTEPKELSLAQIILYYIAKHSTETFVIHQPLPPQRMSANGDIPLSSFNTLFKWDALKLVYNFNNNDDKEHIFNAFLPIATYYSDEKKTNSYTAVTPFNEKEYYRFTDPMPQAPQWLFWTTGGLTKYYDIVAWLVNVSSFGQKMSLAGKTSRNLLLEDTPIFSSDNEIPWNWGDANAPIYSKTAQLPEKEDNEYPLQSLGITPRFAVEKELYYDYKKLIPVVLPSAKINRNKTYLLLLVGLIDNEDNFTPYYHNNMESTLINSSLTDKNTYPLFTNSLAVPASLWEGDEDNQLATNVILRLNKQGILRVIRYNRYFYSIKDLNSGKSTVHLLCEVQDYISNTFLVRGYYDDNKFYSDIGKQDEITPLEGQIFLDLNNEDVFKDTDIFYTYNAISGKYEALGAIGDFKKDYKINAAIYDENDNPVNFEAIEGLPADLSIYDDEYKIVEDFDIENKEYYTFDEKNNTYTYIPTICNLDITEDSYSYFASGLYQYNSQNEDLEIFNIDLNAKNKVTNKEVSKSITLDFKGDSLTYVFEDTGDKLTFSKSRNTISVNNVINTNGDFWYNYRNNTANEILQEQAAMIEVQLTEYWMQAYTASKYCDYFLPETWVLTQDGDKNVFSSMLYKVTEKIVDNKKFYNLQLLNTLLPEARIYSEKYQTRLPKYVYALKNNGGTIASDVENIATKQMFDVLAESSDNWYAIDNGTTTYYYNKDPQTGMTWKNFLKLFFQQDSEVSGLYVMSYYLTNKRYKDYPQLHYTELKEKQQALWRNLYQKYGFLLLENNYTNETATNSLQLLQMAQLAFKDYSKPEANYNITMINTASLKDYDGGEIRIGDGIRIAATQYYDLYDTVYKDLSQFLFVTGMSYDLRKATDINLNVNAIKYQDKLIQKLVKLIQ